MAGKGKGRAPCCDKTKVKKGPWSPGEDLMLISFIQKHGHPNWRALPQQAGLSRCGKSCRLRWINYLRPDVKRGNFSLDEEEAIIRLHKSMGNKWSKIASHLPGRTDNEIKNIWNTHLKKRLARNGDTCDQNQCKDSSSYSSSSPASSSSCISYGDINLDKGPGIYEPQESVAEGTHEEKQADLCKTLDEPKEESLSPGHSNISSNVQSFTNIQEVSMPMQETATPIQSNVTSQVQSLVPTEAKQGKDSNEKIEIPFDSDFDIWSLLDSLNPVQPSEFQEPEPEFSKQESTNFGEVTECKKWLRYFENELGLTEGTDSDSPEKDMEEELVMKVSENELMFKPDQTYPATSYFSMWASPPQDFGI